MFKWVKQNLHVVITLFKKIFVASLETHFMHVHMDVVVALD